MRLVLYQALLCICYFLAIGVDPVAAKRHKCYYVDENNNKLGLVSHQRGSEKHKPVVDVKKVDNKHHKHLKAGKLDDKHVLEAQKLENPSNGSVHTNPGLEQQNQQKVNRLKVKTDENTPENGTTKQIHDPDHGPDTIDSKVHTNKSKDKLKAVPTNPKEDIAKPAKVHYHPKPSDSSLNAKTTPKNRHGHHKDETKLDNQKSALDAVQKSKKSKLVPIGEKSKQDPDIELPQVKLESESVKKQKSLSKEDSKPVKNQVEKRNSDSKHNPDNHHSKNNQTDKIEPSNAESKMVPRPNSEIDASKDNEDIGTPEYNDTKDLNSKDKYKEQLDSKDPDTDDKQSHPQTKSHAKHSSTMDSVPSLKLNVQESSLDTRSNDPEHSALVHQTHPLSVSDSETEKNDMQKEIIHLIAFLQKLVTYGPIVNPEAYGRAPKSLGSSEKTMKLDPATGNDLKNQKNDSKSEKSESVESIAGNQAVLEHQSVESHINNDSEGVEKKSTTETGQCPYLSPSNSLSNTNSSNELNNAAPKALNQHSIEPNDNFNREQHHDHHKEPKESNESEASGITAQPQKSIQENISTDADIQHEPSNQLEPSIAIQESNPLPDPHPDTNLDSSQPDDPDSQKQSEMAPVVDSDQPKENPIEGHDPVTSKGPQNSDKETETTSEAQDPEPTTEADAYQVTIEPTVQQEAAESSIQEEKVEPSTQSPAPVITSGNPWLMHIFGKFSHLVKM